MTNSYTLEKAIKEEKELKKIKGAPKEIANYLLKNNRMKGHHLGACLDSCRWGAHTTVMYEMSVKEMIGFIQTWVEHNKNNFQNLLYDSHLLYESLNEDGSNEFSLPHINHDVCPHNEKHKGTIMDISGKTRCAHIDVKKYKPSYLDSSEHFDSSLGMNRINYFEHEPEILDCDYFYDDDGKLKPEYEKIIVANEKELEAFENEEPTEVVKNICYAIISDGNRILPLETIVRRLNLSPETRTVYCPGYTCTNQRLKQMSEEEREFNGRSCWGHKELNHHIVFPFDGQTLAHYTQKWFEQVKGDNFPPWFE